MHAHTMSCRVVGINHQEQLLTEMEGGKARDKICVVAFCVGLISVQTFKFATAPVRVN